MKKYNPGACSLVYIWAVGFLPAACNKKVDSQSAADHQGELYCRACHSRQFGLRGYGYAAGAGTMLSMDSGPPRRGDRE